MEPQGENKQMCRQRFQFRDSFGHFVKRSMTILTLFAAVSFAWETAGGQTPVEQISEPTRIALSPKTLPVPSIPFQNKSEPRHSLSLGNSSIDMTLPNPAESKNVPLPTFPVDTHQAGAPVQSEGSAPVAPAVPFPQATNVSIQTTGKTDEFPLVLPGPVDNQTFETSATNASTKPVAIPQWAPLPTTILEPETPPTHFAMASNKVNEPIPLGPVVPSPEAKANADSPKDDAQSVSSQLESLQKEIDDLKKGMKKKQDVADPNKKFVNKIGGLLMLNPLFVSQDDANKAIYGDAQNQLEFQDLRVSLTGKGYGNLAYECTFAYNNGINFKDLRLTINDTPWLDEVRLGYFKVETGMNLQEWASNAPFISQNSNTKTFRFNRRIGAGSAHYFADERLRVFGGIFCGKDFNPNNDAKISSDLSGIILNTRITALPIYCEYEDGTPCNVLHVGGNFSWVDPSNRTNNTTRLRVRPTTWTGSMPYMLNGTLALEEQTYSQTGLEAAWQRNQFAIQSEAFIGSYEDYSSAWSYNIVARYFLTPGACRIYNKHKGCFGKVHVPKNFMIIDQDGCRFLDGWGAWELTAMYTKMDLENLRLLNNPSGDTSLRYGMYDEFIVGLNWFWNPQTAIMFNYIHSETDGAAIGTTDRSKSSNDTIAMQLRLLF